jgi:uncharacterized protein with von Willebrand factor type A (vWA) domain
MRVTLTLLVSGKSALVRFDLNIKSPEFVFLSDVYNSVGAYALPWLHLLYHSLQSSRIRQAVYCLNKYVLIAAIRG